jgi:Mn2+/Fe2+ NRAMP family transporter
MPHNIYLHSALVQSRKINSRVVGRIKEAVAYFNIESAIALAVSLLINLFVLSVFAKGFYGREEGDIGLENAGQFLGRTFGLQMKYIWAVGLLAAGQSSTMTGTYTGQFVMSGFLDIRMSLWVRITVTRLIAILPTLLVAVTYRNSKGTELDVLNEWLNVLNSVQLPFALVPVLTMTASSKIMGTQFSNSATITTLAWAVALLIMAINLSAIYDFALQHLPRATIVFLVFLLVVLFYIALICYLALGPERIQRLHARYGKRREGNGYEPLLVEEEQQLQPQNQNGHTSTETP